MDGKPVPNGQLDLTQRLPGRSGLGFWGPASARIDILSIFITGWGDIPIRVKGDESLAVEFRAKPERDQNLLDAVLR